ncbi:MAG: 16S rRNA (cytidine(1402)-2'-O)-methyltransferase [Actinobacteria bacterium]|nr:16S rRNA (cytidine(1402)-2'-O)-methyltransferase [Actinomycetota bacterium]
MTSTKGALVLVATPIGNLGDLSPRATAELAGADVIAAEDTRRTRKLLTHAGIPGGRRLVAFHEHNEAQMAHRIVEDVRKGQRVVCVTDAGTPAISDPGARVVQACIAAGLPVEVVPGPSAVLAALVLSGFPTDRFVFEGFLPRKGRERAARLDALAAECRTAVLFEAPPRLAATLAELAERLGPARPVALARELTKLHEEIWRGTLGECVDALPIAARGEVAVVLGPAAEPSAPSDGEVADALDAELRAGASARDAAASVAQRLGIAKRRAYDLAVRRKAQRSR